MYFSPAYSISYNSMSDKGRIFFCLLVCLASFTQGVMYSLNSFAFPQLMTQANKTSTSSLIIPYISSSHIIGSATGAIFSGMISNCGPLHRVIPFVSFFTAVSWGIIALVRSLSIIVAAKFFMGFFIVLECSQVPLYIADVCPEKYSGYLLSLFSITRNFSQIAASAAAQVGLSYSFLTIFFAVVPSLLLALSALVLTDERKHKNLYLPKRKATHLTSIPLDIKPTDEIDPTINSIDGVISLSARRTRNNLNRVVTEVELKPTFLLIFLASS